MKHRRRPLFFSILTLVMAVTMVGAGVAEESTESRGTTSARVDLSPEQWQADYDQFMKAQASVRKEAGYAEGDNGAVTVAYNALAARAGLEALKQGGNAIDGALTTALTQVALTGGAPISYFGIMSLVYYDAESGEVHTMNAEWNTVLGEDDPLSIPGGVSFASDDGLRGTGEPSGRTALVGGFMKGVGAAHARFGRLPFQQLFEPSIYIAERGMPVTDKFEGYLDFRGDDLLRLAETRKIFTRPDGKLHREGDGFRQTALAATLRKVAEHGTDYMYKGPWAKRLVDAVNRDGGKMTLEDLESYEVEWAKPLVAAIGDPKKGYEIYTNPAPNLGGVGLIEAQNLARASGMLADGHWTESGRALGKAANVAQMMFLNYLPEPMIDSLFPDLDMSSESRVTREHAEKLWQQMEAGKKPFQWKSPEAIQAMKQTPKHSDDVVVIDKDGNIAAITQSINCVLWGKTAIVVDGITIGDPASFQQVQINQAGPGKRLPAPTETGILFKQGEPVLGFASMGSGLHQRTFQGLLNVVEYDMDVREAIDTADFFMPQTDPQDFKLTLTVPAGRFPREVLDGSGLGYEEIDTDAARFGGEGIWVAISRDPKTGRLEAASHNRNNSAAVAF